MFETIHVRRARPSDRARILSLQADTVVGDTAPGDAADEIRVIEALLEEVVPDLDGLIAAGRYFVAEADGQVVGGAGWASQDTLGHVAFIRGLGVDPAHRAGGVARRLVEIAEDAAVTAGYDVILAPVPAATADLFATLGYRASGAVEIELAAGRRLQRRKMWKHAA